MTCIDTAAASPAPRQAPSAGVIIGTDGLARPAWAAGDELLRQYYDHEWGMPVRDEHGMFERISLEAFQSGLSWATILRKRPAFRDAFRGFDPEIVAGYDHTDIERLLNDQRIVRNRRKIEATITNAKATIDLRAGGGLVALVWSFQPRRTPRPRKTADIPTASKESLALSRELRRRGFTFVGPTTMFALMEAIGIVDTHLLGSHRRGSSGIWSDSGRRHGAFAAGDDGGRSIADTGSTGSSNAKYVLLDPDGQPYLSTTPGQLGGHRRGKIYGRLDCPAALRAITAGGYVTRRVFFADEATAVAAGYRPCAVCLPDAYRKWKNA